jgi:DNA mismatch repair protein MSH5
LIGSFVPAESAVVGYTDRILSRIQTKETVSKAESAFTHDLIQVNLALANATPRSIVLLDEFGKGTATSDGIALLCGTLEHFADRAERCPKVLCATHFHEIFTNSLLVDTPLINYFVMEVLQAPGTRSLTFLYR